MIPPRPRVLGPVVDAETRCVHYATPRDVIAIKFGCCGEFYPCHLCHLDVAGHPVELWPASARAERAVLCGVCGEQLSIDEYAVADGCPACRSPFNPGCKLHWNYYFE